MSVESRAPQPTGSNQDGTGTISVVSFKWNNTFTASRYKKYTADHVNAMKRMVDKHLSIPHQMVCFTDDPDGLDPQIRAIPLPESYWRLPHCYPKIILFSGDCRDTVGEHFLYIDLDAVITGNLDSLVPGADVEFTIHAKPVKFRFGELLRSKSRRMQKKLYRDGTKFNGGLMYLKAGCRTRVLESFDLDRAIATGQHYCVRGSDQVWIQHCLGGEERTWTAADGIYSYVSDLSGKKRASLPGNAKIVLFGGQHAPWDSGVIEASPWIAEHYPLDMLG